MAKSSLKTSHSSLRVKLIIVSNIDTRPIERHKTVVPDPNPRVDPDLDLQDISLNQKQSGPMSYIRDVTLCLVIGIKFGSNLMPTSKPSCLYTNI